MAVEFTLSSGRCYSTLKLSPNLSCRLLAFSTNAQLNIKLGMFSRTLKAELLQRGNGHGNTNGQELHLFVEQLVSGAILSAVNAVSL